MKSLLVIAVVAVVAAAVAVPTVRQVTPLAIPTLEIFPGVDLPMQGLGTWLYNNSRAEAAVELALSLGYVSFDTAHIYGNSVGIGRALKAAKVKYGRDRKSYFVQTKVNGGLNYSTTIAQHDVNLAQLGTDYVDLLLIHFPSDIMVTPPVGSRAMRQAQWRAMETLFKQGKAKAIGVSHFCKQHLDDILAIAEVQPAVNQVQYHVGMGTAPNNATDDKPFDAKVGVHFQSFSPLCGPCGTHELIDGPLVTKIGKKYNVSGVQVSLRWIVQQGIPVIPKTDKKEHLLENADLFSWKLDAADMATLTAQTKPAVDGTSPTNSGDCQLP
jgi:diketogulonate reductase-like aldo/keto reductase